MKSYQFYTEDGRGGTMLCDDEDLQQAVQELQKRFNGIVKVQYGSDVWEVTGTSVQASTNATTTQELTGQNSDNQASVN